MSGPTGPVVVDASAVVALLLDSRDTPALATCMGNEDQLLLTPGLCDVEVVSALRGLLQGGRISAARAQAGLEILGALPLDRVEALPLLSRVLALRDNFSAYDAVYVAAAEAVGGTLMTGDARLARATRRHTAVEVVVP